jgi:maltooligosyltrehalose trehalohydrolase
MGAPTVNRRIHTTPFGTQTLDEGGVLFKPWVPPEAKRVDWLLYVVGLQPVHSMTALVKGWFEQAYREGRRLVKYRYRIDGGLAAADPASRFQSQDAESPSRTVNPGSLAWRNGDWRGRRWEEAIFYELDLFCRRSGPEGDPTIGAPNLVEAAL